MAPLAFVDAKIYVGGYDLSGYANEIMLSISPEMLDSTVFGLGGSRRYQAGLQTIKVDGKGFQDYALTFPPAPHPAQTESLNAILHGRIGAASTVMTVAPLGNAEDDVAHTFQNVNGKYEAVAGQVGALVPWSLDAHAVGVKAVRSFVAGRGTKSATGNTAAGHQFVGGVPSGKSLFASLHVLAAAGTTPTLDVIVQSDDNAGFSSATTRLTFSQFTTSVGASWLQVAGPITDDYYRMRWTLGGGSPQYTIFGVIGVL